MRVAFFDVAGTVATGEPWRYMLKHPQIDKRQVRMIYARFLPFWLGKRVGIVSDVLFRDRWVREMARLLKGWSRAQIDMLFDWILNDNMQNDFFPVIVERIRQHKQNGEGVVLVSGVFDGLGERFAAQVGADAAVGSRLRYQNEMCSGAIDGKIVAGEEKVAVIRHYLQTYHLPTDLSQHYAYADSYSDLPMLSAVGNAFAVYPEDALKAVAVARGWTIID
jgi:alcohol-forming fatty acyl-CoA reductase